MRMSHQRKDDAVPPEVVKQAEDLGVPELVKAPCQDKPKVDTQPIRVFTSEMEERLQNPQRHDIIQIVAKPNEYWARIGIVHEVKSDGTLICYAPGKGGFPYRFKTHVDAVAVVGQAKLKYNKTELPEPSVYSEEAGRLDAI